MAIDVAASPFNTILLVGVARLEVYYHAEVEEWHMGVQSFVRFAVAEYAEQARKQEPGIGEGALIKKCVELATEAIGGEDGLAAQAVKQASQLAQAIGREIDFQYWCQLASWTPEEAASLALGFDPHDVRLMGFADDNVYRRFEDLKRVAERHLDAQEDPAPAAIFRHMKRFDAEFPKQIWKNLRKNEKYKLRFERKYRNLKRTSKDMADHKDSYLKLIYALAVDRFHYSKGGEPMRSIRSKLRWNLQA
ncbi:hypothetical protein [Xanthobacter versatilis]|uniref:hypothetical protein n=1 Tax=Xanthobacter autotrophicus (strain ATCC BAA-1158 / Py2) TaxID=78245 RepID=UPI00372C95F1